SFMSPCRSSFLLRHTPTSISFPYTTLFRSCVSLCRVPLMKVVPRITDVFVISAIISSPPRPFCDERIAPFLKRCATGRTASAVRSEEHTSELQSPCNLVCRLLLEKKKPTRNASSAITHPEAVLMLRLQRTSFSSL